MPSSTKLPAPEASDPREVAVAIEEANAHWVAGKESDAADALAHAAEAAEHASLTERAATLRAAAGQLSPFPVARSPGATSSGRPPPPSAVAKASTTPSARAPGVASHAPPPPSARVAAGAQPSVAPTAAAPVTVSSTAAGNGSTANGAAANGAGVASAASADGRNGKQEGMHVWVRTSARDPTLLLVRLLPDGHPAPPGAYEAYLRPVEEGVNLLTPKH